MIPARIDFASFAMLVSSKQSFFLFLFFAFAVGDGIASKSKNLFSWIEKPDSRNSGLGLGSSRIPVRVLIFVGGCLSVLTFAVLSCRTSLLWCFLSIHISLPIACVWNKEILLDNSSLIVDRLQNFETSSQLFQTTTGVPVPHVVPTKRVDRYNYRWYNTG